MQLPFFISLIFCFLLSACTTSPTAQQQIPQWQGKNIQVLKQHWGPPSATLQLANGHIIYQYTHKNFFTISGPPRSTFMTNNTLFTRYTDPWRNNQTRVRYCRVTIETNKHGNIIHTRLTGNNCRAYTFPQ